MLEALAVVNAGAATSRGPLRRTLYSLKVAVLERLIASGAKIRYLYRYTPPRVEPWREHPDLLRMEGGPYHWDLIEIDTGSRSFHIPVPVASELGLIEAISDRPVEYAKRKSKYTGSKASLTPPPPNELANAAASLIEWLVREEQKQCAA